MRKGLFIGAATVALLFLLLGASTAVKYVTPANITASNFVTRTALTASNTLAFTVVTNEFAINAYKTNGAVRGIYSVSIQLTAAAAGTAKVSLVVEHGSTITNKVSVSAGPLASLVTIEELILPVGPSERYYLTNETSGVGASVAVVVGTSSLTTW